MVDKYCQRFSILNYILKYIFTVFNYSKIESLFPLFLANFLVWKTAYHFTLHEIFFRLSLKPITLSLTPTRGVSWLKINNSQPGWRVATFRHPIPSSGHYSGSLEQEDFSGASLDTRTGNRAGTTEGSLRGGEVPNLPSPAQCFDITKRATSLGNSADKTFPDYVASVVTCRCFRSREPNFSRIFSSSGTWEKIYRWKVRYGWENRP